MDACIVRDHIKKNNTRNSFLEFYRLFVFYTLKMIPIRTQNHLKLNLEHFMHHFI